MHKLGFALRGAFVASALMVAVPALAGDEERALAAISEAQGKIDAATRVKAGDVSPDALAHAQASVRLAREELKSGHEQKAISAAIEAQQCADTAIGRAQQRSDANAQANAATVADAQQQADAANARAAAAEQAAAAATADAQAARATVVVAAPAPEATVTTETVTPATPARTTVQPKRKVVHRKTTNVAARPVVTEKTTTTLTTR